VPKGTIAQNPGLSGDFFHHIEKVPAAPGTKSSGFSREIVQKRPILDRPSIVGWSRAKNKYTFQL
jgi:hypothetical protein